MKAEGASDYDRRGDLAAGDMPTTAVAGAELLTYNAEQANLVMIVDIFHSTH